MAKIIRFPLMMKDGIAVRTLDELREHFDLESLLGYFADGKLRTWLADRYYDEKAQKIAELSADLPNLKAKLCEILGVDYSAESDNIDLEYLKKQEKLKILRMFTDDQTILDNIDAVAFDQEELFDILDEAPAKIYLYGEKFSIPYAKRGITYIGVNTPIVSLEKSTYEYEDNGINLINVNLADSNPNVPYVYAERLYIKGDYEKALPLIRKETENGNPRAMGLLAIMYYNGLGCEYSKEKGRKLLNKAKDLNEPLSTIYYTYYYLADNNSDLNFRDLSLIQAQTFLKSIDAIQELADSGDTIAQFEYAYFKMWGCKRISPCVGENNNKDGGSMNESYTNYGYRNKKAIRFLFESANKGFAPSIRMICNQCFSIVPRHFMFFHDHSIGLSVDQWKLEKLEKFNRYFQEGKIEDIYRMFFY
ncbi:MAG: hypothetical protein J5747_10330 [Spirochaetaceae bacterium]|nr:hypothetical protein [Spirochaetaceae bacterium]